MTDMSSQCRRVCKYSADAHINTSEFIEMSRGYVLGATVVAASVRSGPGKDPWVAHLKLIIYELFCGMQGHLGVNTKNGIRVEKIKYQKARN